MSGTNTPKMKAKKQPVPSKKYPRKPFNFVMTDNSLTLSRLVPGSTTCTVSATKSYDPYGAQDPMGSAVGQGEEESSLGFQAAQTDKVTGRILLGPRQYDPTTERFTTADSFVSSSADLSLGTDPLTGNRYLFAAANPVAFFDDGHAPHYGGGSGRWKRTCDGWDKACGQRRTGAPHVRTSPGGPGRTGDTRNTGSRGVQNAKDPGMCLGCLGRRLGNLLWHGGLTYGSWAVARVNGAHCTSSGGMNICYGVKGPLSGVIPRDAITLGGTVLFELDESKVTRTFLAHEISHGSQFAAQGPLFVPSYIAGEGYAAVTGRCNPLELEAAFGRRHGC
jgi:RHS repeat-associated protein